MADYTFSPKNGRYRDSDSGRFVSEATVREAVDRLADDASARLASLSERLLSKDITLEMWQRDSMTVLKDAHVAAATIAHGGREQMGQDDWGFVGHRIRDEYQHLREFARQISDGTQALDGRVIARSKLYGQGARTTFTATQARDQAGYGMAQEKNVLHADESCASCLGEDAKNWVPLGDLVPPGSRTCLSNCKCSLTYRATPASESGRLLWAV